MPAGRVVSVQVPPFSEVLSSADCGRSEPAGRLSRRPGTRRRGLFASLILLAALAAQQGPAARAASVRPLGLQELVSKADVIVVGVAQEQQSRFRPDHSAIVTDVAFEPEQVLKGSAAPGVRLFVTHLGGVVDGVGLQVPGEVLFEPGERALLFLRRSSSDPDTLRVVGMAQGKLAVQNRDNIPMVLPEAGQGALHQDAPDTSVTGHHAAVEPAALAEVIERIRTLLQENP